MRLSRDSDSIRSIKVYSPDVVRRDMKGKPRGIRAQRHTVGEPITAMGHLPRVCAIQVHGENALLTINNRGDDDSFLTGEDDGTNHKGGEAIRGGNFGQRSVSKVITPDVTLHIP
jgi:hypothetical protein